MFDEVYEEYAQHVPTALYVRVDAEDAEDIVDKYKPTSWPTFLIFHEKEYKDTLTLDHPEKLEEALSFWGAMSMMTPENMRKMQESGELDNYAAMGEGANLEGLSSDEEVEEGKQDDLD
jgi:hypothetical protein